MATPKIRSANAASTSTLAPTLPRFHRPSPDDDSQYRITLVAAATLPLALQDRIYDLFHTNMSPLSATSSLSYTERSKREELFDETGRLVLLSRHDDRSGGLLPEISDQGVDMPGGLPPSKPGPWPGRERDDERWSGGKGKGRVDASDADVGGIHAEDIVGYVSFRFDTEETLGPKDVEVIYCYELQLDTVVRRKGLAKVLMLEMEAIGRRRGMEKAMLTCLKANQPALRFYRQQGYEADEIDPTRMAAEPDSEPEDEDEEWERVGHEGEGEAGDDGPDDGVDYVILSKPLR